MGFRDDLKRFTAKVTARNQATFLGTVTGAHTSMVEGSAVTGSPGQPVDEGTLRQSFQTTFESPSVALISTKLVYAAGIEEGVGPHGPITLRSAVGGFHSRKLTMAGLPRIVALEAAKAKDTI